MGDQPAWVAQVLGILLWLVPLAVWITWWLGAVNWQKAWAALRQGAWLGVALGVLMAALVWSEIDPTPTQISDLGAIPSFWARLGCVGGLAALALFCGWLQGVLGWIPPEIEVEPPEGRADLVLRHAWLDGSGRTGLPTRPSHRDGSGDASYPSIDG